MSTFIDLSQVLNIDELWIECENDFHSFFIPVREIKSGKKEKLNELTMSLILCLLLIGIEEVTESNTDEILIRLTMLSISSKDIIENIEAFNILHIKRHIGLKVGIPSSQIPFEDLIYGETRKQAKKIHGI